MTVKHSRHRDIPHGSRARSKRHVPYGEMFWKLPPKERQRINDTIISAVRQLNNARGCAPPGTKAFLEARARQLITDTKLVGFTKAAQRLRVAVKGWKRERAHFYRPSDEPVPAPPAKAPAVAGWALTPSSLKAPRPPAKPYFSKGDEDLLAIPSALNRKAEVSLDHPLRRRKKAQAKAA